MSAKSSELPAEHVSAGAHSAEQFQQLVEVISRSQHGFRELIDNLDQAVFTIAADGVVHVANRYLAEMLGVTFQDLIGHNLAEFMDSPSLKKSKQQIASFAEMGSWSGVIPVRLKRDRKPRHFRCWLQPGLEDGRVVSISGWARDVTSQHDSEIRFTELFRSLREGIFFSTPDGKLLDANPAMVQILGYASKKELQSRGLRDLYQDPAVRDALIEELDREGVLQNREIVFLRKDGKPIYCLASGFAIRDAAGRMVQTQGTIVDITERREIEKKLHNEQEFVRRLIDSFPDMVAVFDRDRRFTYVSQRVRDVLGVEPSDFIGQEIGWRSDPQNAAELRSMLDSVISGGEGQASIEFRARHACGDERTMRVNAAPLLDESGHLTGVVASVRDITELKLAISNSAQQEKFAAMGQMLAGAAHELNNPLTAILGVSDLLRESAADQLSRRQANLVYEQARRAATIVQELLAFSRPPAQSRPRLRLDEIVRQAIKHQETSLSQKKIAVTFDSPPGLLPIEGDPKLLVQVFVNIIVNAEKAISDYRDRGSLSISLAQVGNRIRVTLTDDGPGISPADLGRIFDPFFTTKRPGGNPGLGLTICLAIVKDHGGNIEVQSSPGSHATFSVYLPVAPGALPDKADTAPAAAKTVPIGLESLRGRSVLVVDDEEGIREIVEGGLSARGMQVATSDSAEAALSYLESHLPDVVISDFHLPGLTGTQFFDKVRDRFGGAAPSFIFITGELVDSNGDSKWGEKGASILQKPFQISGLAEHLVKVLSSKSLSSHRS
jgi:PAS domain S-box-containing protein